MVSSFTLAYVASLVPTIAFFAHAVYAADTYIQRTGRLAGNDVLNGTYSYSAAARACSSTPACAGFSWEDVRNNGTFNGTRWVRFKPSIALVLAPGTRSAIKNYPPSGPDILATVFRYGVRVEVRVRDRVRIRVQFRFRFRYKVSPLPSRPDILATAFRFEQDITRIPIVILTMTSTERGKPKPQMNLTLTPTLTQPCLGSSKI